MQKFLVMAGATASGWVSAYVVLSAGHESRVFKLSGKVDAPVVDELAAATTLDIKRFQEDLAKDLFGMGPAHGMNAKEKEWATEVVRTHVEAQHR